MLSIETLENFNLFKYLWVGFVLFWFFAGWMTFALFYHWVKFPQLKTVLFRFTQLVFVFGMIFLFFLSFFFFIKI